MSRFTCPSTEVWKPIPGYEGLYEVSCIGRVRSPDRLEKARRNVIRRRSGRVLKERFDSTSTGYSYVGLSMGGKSRKVNVHTLVLEAFLGPRPSPNHQACHQNGDRTDARLLNLRWDTVKENAADRWRHGTMPFGEKHSRAVLSEELATWVLESPQSSLKLSPILGVASSTIRAIRLGQNWRHLR